MKDIAAIRWFRVVSLRIRLWHLRRKMRRQLYEALMMLRRDMRETRKRMEQVV